MEREMDNFLAYSRNINGECQISEEEKNRINADKKISNDRKNKEKATNKKTKNFFIKKDNATLFQKISWTLVPIISIAGLWYYKLGLIMPVMMLLILFISFFRGRIWCGNFCPRGALLDIFIKPISFYGKILSLFKTRLFRWSVIIIFMTLFTLRTKAAFSTWNTMEALDKWGFVFVTLCLVTTIIAVILGIFVSPRTWCTFCPMGTMQKWLYGFHMSFYKK